jgi:cytochrome c553
MRRKFGPPVLLAIALCGPALARPSHAVELAGDFSRGKARAKSEQCQECHGETGLGTAEHYPRLAGQQSTYIAKQLRDFQSGARKNEIMTAMAADLSPQDIADIAAYFSRAATRVPAPGNFSALGESLYHNGDSARGIAACATCHGATAAGADAGEAPVPALAAQSETYLANQLFVWKVGERGNSVDGAMNAVTQSLSSAEIDALAKYISGLGATAQIAD